MWPNGLRICRILLLAACLCGLTGCFGVSQNPSYFPFLCPTGDIIPTHAKPPGHGYYANFDPNAVRVEVRPLSQVSPVQTQHVIVATVYDSKGTPRRQRRVEWLLDGVGSIMEVDESGHFPGRGYKQDSKYAVSYTNYGTHLITRGNLDPKDDFLLNPGQTWCVVTSPTEGDSFVTVYVPGISNWDQRKVVVNVRWVDAIWVFPAPAQARSGTQHVFNTQVMRYTDKQPLANYRVRYRIVDGPSAVLLPNQTQEAVVVSDLKGNAQIGIAQKAPAQGINQVEVEIIRPPDPTQPSGSGIVVAKGITTIEWLAPGIAMTHTGPPAVGLGQEAAYNISVANTGKIETQSMTVTNPIPPELLYIRSNPPAVLDGKTLTWTLGTLPPGQSHNIQVFYQASKNGTITNCATVVTEEGLKDTKCVATEVTEPRLKINITGPNKGAIGEILNYTVTLENPGSGPADNILLTAVMSQGLEPQGLKPEEKDTRLITSQQGSLKPLEQRVIPLQLVPRGSGQQTIRVSATANGGLKAEAPPFLVDVAVPQLDVKLNGPQKKYVDRPAEWNITVTNPSDIALTNVMVRDLLPPQLVFENASAGGTLNEKNEVVWDLGTLGAKQTRVLQLTTRAGKIPAVLNHTVVATAPEYGLSKEASSPFQIEGIPALKLEAIDIGDPAEVGKQVTYQIEVTNTGSEVAADVQIVAKIPAEMKILGIRGGKATTSKEGIVTYDKLPALEAGKTIKYEIDVQAEKPGDVRFKVEMTAKDLKQPVIEEESTSIIDPAKALPNAPPIPIPPLGPPMPVNPMPPNGTSAIGSQPNATPNGSPSTVTPPNNSGGVPPVPPPTLPLPPKM